jgi:hydroxypyruvate isomerase
LRTAADVVAVIDRVHHEAGVDNVRLLADLYHLSVNGDNVDVALERHAARVGHVQVADAPGRHEPGTGLLEIDRHLRALEASGYDGWVGLEYAPSTDTIDSLGWLPTGRRRAA